MQIKESGESHWRGGMIVSLWLKVFGQKRGVKRLFILTGVLIFLGGLFFYGIHVGATLRTQHQGLRAWGMSIARHQLSFVPNIIEGWFAQPERFDIEKISLPNALPARPIQPALTAMILVACVFMRGPGSAFIYFQF